MTHRTRRQSAGRTRYSAAVDIPDVRLYRLLESMVGGWWTKAAVKSARGRQPRGFVERDLHVTLTRIDDEGDGVRALWLAHNDGQTLPAWEPGAHVDVVLPSGQIRQYSLNSDPGDLRQYRIAVRRIDPSDGGGGSAEVHTLEVGQNLTLRGPRHAFPFIRSERGYLFIAGGIGVTPILPMLRAAVRRGDPYVLVYTGRTRASMPFLDEIHKITGGRSIHIRPDDERGVPDPAAIIDLAPQGAALYVCGPTPMLEAVRAQIPDPQIDTLHYERFSPPAVVGGRAFTVAFADGTPAVEVGDTESALAAVRRVKPGQAYSCRQGFCGTCKVRVFEGEVEHRDRVLTDVERDEHMMLCVSRAEGTIIIDA